MSELLSLYLHTCLDDRKGVESLIFENLMKALVEVSANIE